MMFLRATLSSLFLLLAPGGHAQVSFNQLFLESDGEAMTCEAVGINHCLTSAPEKTQMEDCFLFELEAFETGLYDARRTALYLCNELVERRESGFVLSDSQQALEAMLVSYENRARDWCINALFRRADLPEGMYDKPFFLVCHWSIYDRLQQEFKEEIGLDVVLEVYGG